MTSKAGVRNVFNAAGELIISAKLINHTYVVEEPESKSVANYAIVDSKPDHDAELWHCRLGHLNFQDMLKLKTVAKGVQFAGKLQFCEHCAQFKSTVKPFNIHREKATKPRQVICFDVKNHPRSPEG